MQANGGMAGVGGMTVAAVKEYVKEYGEAAARTKSPLSTMHQ
jgi:hypothetical protein